MPNNDEEASRQIWRKELAIQYLRILQSPLELFARLLDDDGEDFVIKQFDEGSPDPDALLSNAEQYSRYLDPPERDSIQRVLRESVEALRHGSQPSSLLPAMLVNMSTSHHEQLQAISSSLDKGKGYLMAHVDIARVNPDYSYDAMCLFPERVSAADVATVVGMWKQALRDSLNSSLPSHIFWNSRDFYEALDAVSYYRFIETFNIGEFPQTMAEVEGNAAENFIAPGPPIDFGFDRDWLLVAHNLWLTSRSARLNARIRPFVDMALVRVAGQQHDEGWWYSPAGDPRVGPAPSNWATALACAALQRLSRSEAQLEQAKRGAEWLARQQETSGAWPSEATHPERPQEADLLTTLIASEVIKAAGLDGYDNTITTADSWLMAQQKPSGVWSDTQEGLDATSTTVLIVEHMEAQRPPLTSLSNYLRISRDFILRSQELLLENNENARRLAVVVAFQGVESFLYGCLTDPSVNITVFSSPNKTIGVRAALNLLEGHLRSTNMLSQGQSIQYRPALDRLAYSRDQVVHKGAAVAKSDADELTLAAARFADTISQQIFGFALM